ncbi:serine/threonine-protein kinase [Spirosoma luteum]|uniref:serine/threonine-protein kinase n=1 Tax=Spirosoma luteum TaxID=431553 RepID=UPI0003691CC3|nr:serine/threonine-protein kinase [Spirosoma luteum]
MATVSFNTHFPGYDVLGEITRSNARVLKARHIATGDLVAIKHFALNTDADTLRRFERESAIMTQMDHPNIVKVREVRLDTDLPYLVMDYVEGGNLRQLITGSGHLSVEMTIRMGLQILDAFRLIHAHGIVHRDVKPENILYHKLASGELHFLLTDFGVARLHEQPVTQTGQSLMTYEYAAPEQFDNPRQVDKTADYYAFGVVLYECFTGKVPFVLGSETGIVTFMNAVLTTPPPAPVLPTSQLLPEGLEELLRQLLAKKTTDRIDDPDEIKLILKQAEVEQLYREKGRQPAIPKARTESHTPVAAQGAPRPVAKPAQVKSSKPVVAQSTSRRNWLLPALLALVVLGGVLAYWGFNRTDPQPLAVEESTNVTSTTAEVDTARQAEEARLRLEQARQQYQAEVSEATRKLAVRTMGGDVGLFGGVKNLSIQLKNPSVVTFRSVAVKVEYLKGNGRLLKSTVMYFNQVGPAATMTRLAPDSQRGTRFKAKVLRADPEIPDSLSATPSLTP